MGDVLQPGVVIKPQMDKDLAKGLARSLYGVEPLTCQEFNSYDDRNYFMTMSDKVNNENIGELNKPGYVLKVTNSQDSKDPDFTDAQNLMILHMAQDMTVPLPVKNVSGEYKSIEIINNQRHIVRMLKYIPGKILYNVPDWTTKLFYQSGELAARMDNVLSSFDHAAYKDRSTIWSLTSMPQVLNFIDAVKDVDNKRLAEEIINEFIKVVKPLEASLPKGIIHGDLNEQNIIVQQDEDSKEFSVAGVLDFGDSHSACYVYETAIVIMYMMTQCKCIPAYEAGGHVMAGYIKHRSLTDDEKKIIRICVANRYAQSLVMGAYSYAQDPGNEYLLITSKNGWKILHEFWSIPPSDLYRCWSKIMTEYDAANQDIFSKHQ